MYKMKIMYFAFEGFDTQNGTNHLALSMMDHFLRSGAEVYLVSSHSKGVSNDIPDLLENRHGFTYDIVKRRDVDKRSFIKRYLDGIKYAFDCKKRWIKHVDSIDVVILQSTPTAVFSSILLKKYFKKSVVFNSFDIFPDGLYHNGAITNKLIYSFFHNLQKIVYRNSDVIIAISKDMKTTLINNGVPESKIEIVHNWYNDSAVEFVPIENNRFVKKYNVDVNRFIVQYAGNFGYTFDYKMVLDVAEILKNDKQIEFHMIGTGGFAKDFRSEVEGRKLQNIKFFPWQPLEIISDVYSACSVELIPLTKGVIYNSFPSKGSLLMACGKCILVSVESDSSYYREINENNAGICVSRNSPQNVANAILRLKNDESLLKTIGGSAILYGKLTYSSSVNISKLKGIIWKLVNNK